MFHGICQRETIKLIYSNLLVKNLITIKNLSIGKKVSEDLKDRDDWKQSTEAQKTMPFDQLISEIKK